MAKFKFIFWCMGSGKSQTLINIAYEYKRYNENYIAFNHKDDVRYAIGKIASKSGLTLNAETFDRETNFKELIEKYIEENNGLNQELKAVLIDEAQFLSNKQVNQLVKIFYKYNISIICAWLKNNFVWTLFEGSKRLLEVSTELQELKKRCWCGEDATMNARIIDWKIVKSGAEKHIGGDESYKTLCLYHFISNEINWKNN